jgi:hypothetical protein
VRIARWVRGLDPAALEKSTPTPVFLACKLNKKVGDSVGDWRGELPTDCPLSSAPAYANKEMNLTPYSDVRSHVLHPPGLIRNIRYHGRFARLLRFIRWNPPWNSGTGIQALTDLEGILAQAMRCYVFGEPFTTGLGVHNIHQN